MSSRKGRGRMWQVGVVCAQSAPPSMCVTMSQTIRRRPTIAEESVEFMGHLCYQGTGEGKVFSVDSCASFWADAFFTGMPLA